MPISAGFRWNEWNLEHVAKHGVRPEEAESVVLGAHRPYPSYEGDGRFLVRGQTLAGRLPSGGLRGGRGWRLLLCDPCSTVDRRRKAEAAKETTMKTATPYAKMTAAELARATREFDQPGRKPRFGRPPAKLRAAHDRVLKKTRRARGRPVVGAGAQRVQLTVERSLLHRADAYARRAGMTRAQLVARALENLITDAA
jgi:hypothetical protein